MIKDVKFRYLFFTAVFFVVITAFAGCDFSSMSDVKKAEKELRKADNVNAEFWAEPEYKKAQRLLNEAIDFTHERKINEARDASLEALYWATEATNLAIKRAQEMEEEHDGITKKDY
ncbi:hypothetical protein K9N50_10145 [bacterium]|nr:hypothetical protein [bacterium]